MSVRPQTLSMRTRVLLTVPALYGLSFLLACLGALMSADSIGDPFPWLWTLIWAGILTAIALALMLASWAWVTSEPEQEASQDVPDLIGHDV